MNAGDELTPTIHVATTAPMKIFALLMADPNPIHWDPAAVAALGLGDRVINQGPITVSWLADLAANVAGGHERVQRLRARFVGQVREGDRVTCRGHVAAVDGATATLELVAEVDGTPRVTASVVILR